MQVKNELNDHLVECAHRSHLDVRLCCGTIRRLRDE